VSEFNCPASLQTPVGTISFNPTGVATDYYFFTSIAGLDQAGLRTSFDPKPQAHGVIVHPTLRDARHITYEGLVVASSVSNRNSMMDSLVAALESIEAQDGTYRWTPTGQSQKTLTVRCDQPIVYSGGLGGGPKIFVFGLIAPNPAIS
jgi:hypothetical protein